jgi:putative membrane protein
MYDVREYLAEERTFLAWIRTGLAVMAFGFVVARFSPSLEGIRITPPVSSAESHQLSFWFGMALIAAGVAVNLVSAWRHTRFVAELNRGQFAGHGSSMLGIGLACFLALVGIAMAIHVSGVL